MQMKISPGRVEGGVKVPSSKSLTHRAVILATLAEGESVIENPLIADDTWVTLEACRAFGAEIQDNNKKLVIQGTGGKLKIPLKPIDCGFSGTSLRLLTAVAALAPGNIQLTGGERLMERPMEPLLKALRQLGIKAQSDRRRVIIEGGGLRGGEVTLSGETSSQFISALLMVAPYAHGEVSIELKGAVRSRPYIDLTLNVMRTFGGQIEVKGDNEYIVAPRIYRSSRYSVERDWSAAQYWVAAAAVTGGAVRLEDINIDSMQGDKKILEIAERMGCAIQVKNGNITVTGPSKLRAVEIDGGDIPDLVPTIAVLAAFADGMSKITNIAHLRAKESDRLAVPVMELAKMGIHAIANRDSLVIHGGMLRGAVIDGHNDHRIAMAFAVAGLGAEGETVIEGAEAVSKSYPNFWEDLRSLGVDTSFSSFRPTLSLSKGNGEIPRSDERDSSNALGMTLGMRNIVLIGMRGSGKTTVGRMLAERLRYAFVDTDEIVVARTGKGISDIVAQEGWERFRDLESQVVEEVGKRERQVIACGGGAVLREANVKALKQNGIIVWLAAPIEVLAQRVKSDKKAARPPLTAETTLEKELSALLLDREPKYRAAAQLTLFAGDKIPDDIVKEIIAYLNNYED